MDKEKLWRIYCDKNPKFKEPRRNISMRSDMVRKMFDQVWDMAFECGKTFESSRRKKQSNYGNPFNEMFNGPFGGRK
jgi:hypothetical protein